MLPQAAATDDLYEPLELSAVSHRTQEKWRDEMGGRAHGARSLTDGQAGGRERQRQHPWSRLVGVLSPLGASASDASEDMSSDDDDDSHR